MTTNLVEVTFPFLILKTNRAGQILEMNEMMKMKTNGILIGQHVSAVFREWNVLKEGMFSKGENRRYLLYFSKTIY